MNIIAAVDRNWAIGRGGGLLVSIPADMKFFRETTEGKVVVMGRKTLESLPGGRPLKNRTNIVLTGNGNFAADGVKTARDIDELLGMLNDFDGKDIYVIGGESVYRQLLPYCDTAHVTRINRAYEADAYFPNLDEDKEWRVTGVSDEQTYFDLEYYFVRYERVGDA